MAKWIVKGKWKRFYSRNAIFIREGTGNKFFFLFERSGSFSETECPANRSYEVKIDKRFNVKYGQGKTNCQRRIITGGVTEWRAYSLPFGVVFCSFTRSYFIVIPFSFTPTTTTWIRDTEDLWEREILDIRLLAGCFPFSFLRITFEQTSRIQFRMQYISWYVSETEIYTLAELERVIKYP